MKPYFADFVIAGELPDTPALHALVYFILVATQTIESYEDKPEMEGEVKAKHEQLAAQLNTIRQSIETIYGLSAEEIFKTQLIEAVNTFLTKRKQPIHAQLLNWLRSGGSNPYLPEAGANWFKNA